MASNEMETPFPQGEVAVLFVIMYWYNIPTTDENIDREEKRNYEFLELECWVPARCFIP